MRDNAAVSVNDDIEQVKYEIAEISDSVRQVLTSISAVTTLAALPLQLLSPVVGNLIRHRRKR